MNEFNVNVCYTCNSNCVFCAANCGNVPSGRKLSLNEYKQLFSFQPLRQGDIVVINGGEPTLCDDLIEMIKYNTSHGAQTILFTNGRKLSNSSYCELLIRAGVSRLTIPFYGYNAATHDAVTKSTGSFTQLEQALTNLEFFREEHSFEIELKILLCRSNMTQLLGIFNAVCDHNFDRMQVSGIIPSKTAQENNEILTRDETFTAVNGFLDAIWSRIGKSRFDLMGIPLCLLTKKNLLMYINMKSFELMKSPAMPNSFYSYEISNEKLHFTEPDASRRTVCRNFNCSYQRFCNMQTLVNDLWYFQKLITNEGACKK